MSKRAIYYYLNSLESNCYNLGFELSKRYTLVLSNTREFNRVPKYKMSILYTNYWWSILYSFSSILITICLPWDWHILTIVKFTNSGLSFSFIFHFYFYFLYSLFSYFVFLVIVRVRVDQSCCYNSHLTAKSQDRS